MRRNIHNYQRFWCELHWGISPGTAAFRQHLLTPNAFYGDLAVAMFGTPCLVAMLLLCPLNILKTNPMEIRLWLGMMISQTKRGTSLHQAKWNFANDSTQPTRIRFYQPKSSEDKPEKKKRWNREESSYPCAGGISFPLRAIFCWCFQEFQWSEPASPT